MTPCKCLVSLASQVLSGRFPFVRADRPLMRISLLIKTIQPDQSNPKIVCTKEMVLQQKLLEKAYFIVKMTDLVMVWPTSSDFWKAPLVKALSANTLLREEKSLINDG